MQPTLKGTYKGYEIEHGEFTRGYTANVSGSDISAPTMEALCRKIDGIERKEFKRTSIIKVAKWGSSLEKAEVTSHADDKEVWTVNIKGEREKTRDENCYLDTEDTADKLRMAAELQAAINALKKDHDQVIASIERYKISGE